MYIAELKGKLSTKDERKEDILTSNVFSFFKYTDRKKFLKPFLEKLGFEVSLKDVEDAKFEFWPKYDDRTEPDVVIIVGEYYILFEAKYHSGFGEETELLEDQLTREIKMGSKEARKKGKKFYLVAITADYSKPIRKLVKVQKRKDFKWINWHFVTLFLEKKLDEGIQDREFSKDLYSLLIKKKLRIFDGFREIFKMKKLSESRLIFFDFRTARYRGKFIGFLKVFGYWEDEIERHKCIFFNKKKVFNWFTSKEQLGEYNNKVFFGGKNG